MTRGRPSNLSFDFDAAIQAIEGADASEPTPTSVESASVESASVEPAPEVRKEPVIYTVAGLARRVQLAYDRRFPDPLLVEGEVSGVKAAPSGHVYLTLKDPDADACLDVVAYRSSVTPKSRALLREGHAVRLRGRFAFYAARGKTQFLVDRVLPTGKGALLLALERLKAKLEAEGLFDPARKRRLPKSPRIVGIVTSKSGAVLHDIHKVSLRRGGAHLLLAPATVQGLSAAEELRRALIRLSKVEGVDVILLARGGGSAEDLAAFNDESLVRAVAACPVPVVSAVGHETDFTLCDFAADARAATPSQAAEMVVPDRLAAVAALAERRARLHRAIGARLDRARLELGQLERRFGDPRLSLAKAQQRLDELRADSVRALQRTLRKHHEQRNHFERTLATLHPRNSLTRSRERLQSDRQRMLRAFEAGLARARQTLATRAARLDALSPLSVLARGYSITTTADGKLVHHAHDIAVGQTVHVRLARGALTADVTAKDEDE